jgi:SAM-dependent methyltransferase
MDGPKLDDFSDDAIRQLNWYYRVELRPGVFTGGRRRGTLGMVRHQIGNMDVAGRRCLDIGTQEGAVATVLAQAGAGRAVAYDRLDLSDRIALVKQAHGVDFDYQHSCQLDDLPRRLQVSGEGPFDVVIFAGVLYHMIDPLGGIALARSFVREKGLFLLETSAIVSPQPILHFNSQGRFYPGSNYFQVTLGALDYFLRMLRLQVIDCHYCQGAYLSWAGRLWSLLGRRSGNQLCRVSVVCRAVGEPLPVASDKWMKKPFIASDFTARQLDFERLRSASPAVDYRRGENRLTYHRDLDSVDLYRSVVRGIPLIPKKDSTVLRLADQPPKPTLRDKAA